MQIFDANRLNYLFSEISRIKVLVIGDFMLDRYLWGSVTRISPEAPVPVVEIERESERLGGAANVCHNILNLGAQVLPIGVVGHDLAGKQLLTLLKNMNVNIEGIVVDEQRPTTVKTRVIAHNQHVVRFDQEDHHPIGSDIQKKIFEIFENYLPSCDVVLIEDYNKGLLTKSLIKHIIETSIQKGSPITVDPKFDHFFDYQKVHLFKPNRKECEAVLGMKLNSRKVLFEAGQSILNKLQCDHILITLGEEGMLLVEKDATCTLIPARARQIHDVSGAGDTVISTATVALAAGATIHEAATLANFAAGIVCEEVGIVPIQKDKLLKCLLT